MKNLVILVYLSIIIPACTKEKLVGNGLNVVEIRTDRFGPQVNIKNVVLNGSISVKTIYGPNFALQVKGYSNLVSAMKTSLANNTMTIGYSKNYKIKNDNVEVILITPNVPNVLLSGSGFAKVDGKYPPQENLKLQVCGSGQIEAGTGNVDNIELNISGSGKINAYNFISKDVNAIINGSGQIKTTATLTLKANISGSGQIEYFGNPIINTNINGSGKLIKAQ